MIKKVYVDSGLKTEAINVTETLVEMVQELTDGLVLFYIPHTTASLLLCEDDNELRHDIVRTAQKWLMECRPFTHIRKGNPNAEAHILSAFGGNSLTFAVEDGKPDLGKYQNILLLEMDGPKKREIRCKFIGR
jgi:secondary thiamine-phosphate synthase enzyme